MRPTLRFRPRAALAVIAGGLALAAPTAHADVTVIRSTNAGYSAFVNDNDVQLFPVVITNPQNQLTVFTNSYAAPGLNGFATTLSLFTDTGSAGTDILIGQSTDDTGVSDASLNATLTPGSYLVALTQHDNPAVGTTLADGFIYNNSSFSDPDYTGGPFEDFSGTVRTGNWSISIGTLAAAPEPGANVSLGLGAFALVGVALLRRRAQKGQAHG